MIIKVPVAKLLFYHVTQIGPRVLSPLVLPLLVSSCRVHSGLVLAGMSPLVRLFLSYLRSVFSCPVLLSCWLLSCLLMSCLLSSPLVLSTLVLSRRPLGASWKPPGGPGGPLGPSWGHLAPKAPKRDRNHSQNGPRARGFSNGLSNAW